jgi:phage gp16-like protein
MNDREKTNRQKIHIAKGQLRMADDSYRAMLSRHGATGDPPSSLSLNARQLEAVLAEMIAKGFRPKPPKGKGNRTQAAGAEIGKARAVWLFLAEAGVLRNPSEEAFIAYVKRMLNVDDPHWIPAWKMKKLIESLKMWAVRIVSPKLAERLGAARGLDGPVDKGVLDDYIRTISPKLDPNTFDALRAAWERLGD